MLSTLSKLGLEYSFFVSTLHSGRASIRNWKMNSLDAFVESLIQEKDKLLQMGVLRTSKNLSLLLTNSNNAQSRGNVCRNSAAGADIACSSTMYGTSIEQNTIVVYPFPR